MQEVWEYHTSKAAYWDRRLKENQRVFRFVKRSQITATNIGMLVMEDRWHNTVTMPYLGLISLRYVKYLKIVPMVIGHYINRPAMRAVWYGIVLNLYHYEDETLKKQKLAEVHMVGHECRSTY